ncbi:MAG: hypothetical protein ACJA2D_002575 [Pseudohongiellaceae bacterium]|jgi:hypothetical protein
MFQLRQKLPYRPNSLHSAGLSDNQKSNSRGDFFGTEVYSKQTSWEITNAKQTITTRFINIKLASRG